MFCVQEETGGRVSRQTEMAAPRKYAAYKEGVGAHKSPPVGSATRHSNWVNSLPSFIFCAAGSRLIENAAAIGAQLQVISLGQN